MSGTAVLPTVEQFLSKDYIGLIIDGKNVPSSTGKTSEVINPSTGKIIARLSVGTENDVDEAVRAAEKANLSGWADMLPISREAHLRNFAGLIEKHSEELAQLECLDNGKPISHIRSIDVRACAGNLYHAAGWPTKIKGHVQAVSIPGHMAYSTREPLGIVAVILPWNYPLIHCMQKAGPALACGNSVIIKPSSYASLAVVRLGELAQEAGLPPGVFNVVTGPGTIIGSYLASHPGIDKIQMTGSTEAGRKTVTASAGNMKRLALELGNKAPNIIFADADLKKAVPGSFEAAFGNTGQSCVAGSRLYVQKDVYENVLSGLLEMAKNVVIGDAMDPETVMGPIISGEQFETIMGYIDEGTESDAVLQCGGTRLSPPDVPEGGYYLPPTIFTNVADDARIAVEEIFGPVLTLHPFDDEQEAIRRANDTMYGLASAVWTKDVARAHRVAAKLKTGVVWINTYDKFQPTVPFGGFKQSGYGRDNSIEAIEAFTEIKSVWVNIAE